MECSSYGPFGPDQRSFKTDVNFSNTLLVLVNGEGHRDQLEEVKPNSISESNAQTLTKVQQLLNRPGAVYLVE